MPNPSPVALRALAERWADARAAERANAQSYLIELCEALGVERPRPAGSGYEFELPIKVTTAAGQESTNFLDLYKRGHFALEAKDKEDTRSNDLLLRRAFGQLRGYLGHLPDERPPYLLVLDVGRTLVVWDRWRGDYGSFNAGRAIDLRTLADRPDEVTLLRDIWEDPTARDPRGRAEAVTKEIAGRLAQLATELEREGHEHGAVSRFLMRCVFTMFAEDVGLLPEEPFRRVLEVAAADPGTFVQNAEELWRAMDRGERFLLRKLLRFNGHFFAEARALPLDKRSLALLRSAAEADWQDVEPTIFGTLLVRALDPRRRHQLGAEYTPREYVERVVRPTVEQPLRDRWTGVQGEVLQLLARSQPQPRVAAERLRSFLAHLRSLRFLDPACGSGNFLYVTLHAVKRIELEAVRMLEEVTRAREIRLEEVNPDQFHGIEIDEWAREIAELTLWIGFHQFWKAHHDVQPPEPILRDTGTLERRDAVLEWDDIVHTPERDRPDPTPRIAHQVTGKLVPDPGARLSYLEHRDGRPATWPRADFIVGNPPYLGNKRMREAYGDGYVDALRAAYPNVPETADYVMYWWHRAAEEVAAGRTVRAGLITTNSITQPFNRAVVERAMERGAQIAWTVPDHPWVEETDGAAVRVALTVIAKDSTQAVHVRVDDRAQIVAETVVARLNADLSVHADVAGATRTPLLASRGLSQRGFSLVGRGFVLNDSEATALLAADPRHTHIIRPYRNGKDLTARPRGVYTIDFGMRTEAESREYPVLYDLVRTRVKPERDANADRGRRTFWWRFGRTNETLRAALVGLPRYIATAYVSKHRVFTFLGAEIAPDEKLVVIASADAFHLGVLSAQIHVEWALAAGTRLEDRPTYNNTLTFDPFPFPDPPAELRERIAQAAERLDAHRKAALERNEAVTVTGMYNVLEKLRSGGALTTAERQVHELAACGVLRDLHDELGRLVAEAYGWPWPMEKEEILVRLVALHDERIQEEKAGQVRWLRPEYQAPHFGRGAVATELAIEGQGRGATTDAAVVWPATAADQIRALQALASQRAVTVEQAASAFPGARRELVERHLDTLAFMGELWRDATGRYGPALAPM
jgi:hypothetical protein